MRTAGWVVIPMAAYLAGCDAGSEGERPIAPRQAAQMQVNPIPPGTAPRGTTEQLAVLAPPGPSPTMALLRRGREDYRVFCAPCHGQAGHGDGAAVTHGFSAPPSFHADRLAAIEPARVVAVISAGYGKMLPLAERVAPEERWAIAYYVKALQLSQAPPKEGAAAETSGTERR